ncbi:MAG: hypothetical protein AAF352_03635 [Pseudomonadota bacterium]
MRKSLYLLGTALASMLVFNAPMAFAQSCPAITLADTQGVAVGKYPQQYELSEYQAAAGCELTFQENPGVVISLIVH